MDIGMFTIRNSDTRMSQSTIAFVRTFKESDKTILFKQMFHFPAQLSVDTVTIQQ